MINAALIGCGARGKSHAAGFRGLKDARITSLADINPASSEALKAEFELADAAVYQDHRELLAAEKPDAVCIVLWPHLHLPVFRDCVEAGVKAVLCEKPMAPTWEEYQEMARLAEESGVILAFSHQRRYALGNRMVRKLVAEGVIGKPLHLHLFSPPNTLDCGTHTFDQAMSFLGEAKPKWVLGQVDATKEIAWFNVQADSMSVGQVLFEGGVRASLQFGGPDMDIWGGVRITGEKGFFDVFWDGEVSRAVIYDDPAWTFPEVGEDSGDAHMARYVEDVLTCMRDGGEPDAGWRKALQAAELIFAFYESARVRARIELPLTGVKGNPFHDMLAAGEFDEARRIGLEREAQEKED